MENLCDDVLMEDGRYVPLNEIFFGKSNSLVTIEDLFEKVRATYSSYNINTMSDIGLINKVKKDPAFSTIADLIKKQFNLANVMVIAVASDAENCYVMKYYVAQKGDVMQDISFKDAEKSYVVTNKGLKFKNDEMKPSILIMLTTPLLFNGKLSPRELVAVILHEIGHSFSKPVLNKDSFTDRANERFADSFASMYGYSEELVSALSKLTYSKRDKSLPLRDVPILNILNGLTAIAGDIYARQFKGVAHPQLEDRQNMILDQLYSDLKNTPDLSDANRKELLRQIDACKACMQNNEDNNSDISNRMYRFYSKNISKYFGSEKRRNSNLIDSDSINNKLINKLKG